ncbi:MAG: class I SAM-dependent DNA methyltransferase [Bacillota bacterium]
MNSYFDLAYYYDILMDDVNYDEWTDFIIEIAGEYGHNPQDVLDTACGTGNITIPLAKRGCKVYGLDISEDMLAVADCKARKEKLDIKYFSQNMVELDINIEFDTVLCMCDGINYILKEEDLYKYFCKVYEHLKSNGLIIFDISSAYKLKYSLGNNTFFQEKNNIYYIWDNIYNEIEKTVEMNIVFFVPQDKLYRKFEEYHIQKAYESKDIIKMLKQAGFRNIKVNDAFRVAEPNTESDRIFFAAQK